MSLDGFVLLVNDCNHKAYINISVPEDDIDMFLDFINDYIVGVPED